MTHGFKKIAFFQASTPALKTIFLEVKLFLLHSTFDKLKMDDAKCSKFLKNHIIDTLINKH